MGSSTLLGPDHPLARAESQHADAARAARRDGRVRLRRAPALAAARRARLAALSVGAAAVSAGLLVGGVLIARSRAARARIRADRRAGARSCRCRVDRERALPPARPPLPAPPGAHARRDHAAARPPREWWSPVLRRPRGRAWRAQAELREIARLLRELPSVRARGVALVTRLVRDGATSPLYHGPGAAAARGARPHPARARPGLTLARPRRQGRRPARGLDWLGARVAHDPCLLARAGARARGRARASSASRPRCWCGAG